MKYDFERFLNVRSASCPSFSPDGRSVGFLTDITGVPQLWSVPVEGDEHNQGSRGNRVVNVGMAYPGPLDWSVILCLRRVLALLKLA